MKTLKHFDNIKKKNEEKIFGEMPDRLTKEILSLVALQPEFHSCCKLVQPGTWELSFRNFNSRIVVLVLWFTLVYLWDNYISPTEYAECSQKECRAFILPDDSHLSNY